MPGRFSFSNAKKEKREKKRLMPDGKGTYRRLFTKNRFACMISACNLLVRFVNTNFMNFWTFEEDESRGYYQPVSNKAARRHGGQLFHSFVSLVVFILKLVIAIPWAIISLFLRSKSKAKRNYRYKR
jgi:hypothetical protein